MSRFANFFATIRDGKIVMITDATPAHELEENQIMLTYKEYALLRVVDSIEEAKALMDSISYKIGELGDTSIQS